MHKRAEINVAAAVTSGELSIDSGGRVWRHAARRANRWAGATRSIPCAPRRAEKSTPLGYLMVRVMVDGTRHCALAHRLVWHVMRGPIPEGLTINHRNGDRADNRPENLELATYSEQMKDAIRRGYDPTPNLRSRG